MSFQYKTSAGGVLAAVPGYAQGDGGSLALVYPAAPDRDGNGLPCGAVGRPEIVFSCDMMRGDGMKWWQDLFTLSTDESVQLWLNVWNPRTGAWATWTGYLVRPTWESAQVGESTTATVYTGVNIRVVECVAA